MAISLNPERLKRYKDIASLLIKYGSKNIMHSSGGTSDSALDEEIISGDVKESTTSEDGKSKKDEAPEQLAHDLEELGPTFIKLGQLLSTRPDFLPPAYIDALARLQDNVKPFSYEEVEEIIQNQLNVRISKAFLEFDKIPMAAASLGQVHKAKLNDGRPVAVKVQRPGIRETIAKDLDALMDIATTVDKHTDTGRRYAFENLLNEFKKALLLELDYSQEAQNLVKLGENLQRYDKIIVPQPVNDYTTSKVLTMDYVKGTKVASLSPLARLEVEGKVLAEELFKAYLDQVLIDGFFHADPHPGNVFITDDNKIALIDLGMVARIDPESREDLLKLILYVADGRGRDAAEISKKMGTELEDFNDTRYTAEVTEFVAKSQDATLKQIEVGRVVVELTRIAANNGMRVPNELTMLGKTLLNLDQIGNTLDPEFNPNAVIREHAETIFRRHLFKKVSPGNVFSSLLEVNELMQKLPARLNTITDNLATNRFQIKVDAIDDNSLMQNLQKIANRITMGLILAALIIGAALMMRVNSTFTILGYPGLAVLMFMVAAIVGFGLVFNILLRDEWLKRK
jgi:predicted unusual protein kinase regulating ubiquinone biosynthesis (AarF/ABC1/UbiB family)